MNPVKNLWNDTPSEVLNHYQQLVHKVLQVNSRCQVLLYDLLTRAQDFYPGKMKHRFLTGFIEFWGIWNQSWKLADG
jgi:hypothetical protein